MALQEISHVNFTCSNGKRRSAILVLNNILYMSKAGVHLISQGQIHREPLHFFTNVDEKICIGNSGFFACLIWNNLYIMDSARLSAFAFASINKETFQAWL